MCVNLTAISTFLLWSIIVFRYTHIFDRTHAQMLKSTLSMYDRSKQYTILYKNTYFWIALELKNLTAFSNSFSFGCSSFVLLYVQCTLPQREMRERERKRERERVRFKVCTFLKNCTLKVLLHWDPNLFYIIITLVISNEYLISHICKSWKINLIKLGHIFKAQRLSQI